MATNIVSLKVQKGKLGQEIQEIIGHLETTIYQYPLGWGIKKMSNYMKFLKDILSEKRQLFEFEKVTLTECCSTLVNGKIPPKLKDRGSFAISYSIGGQSMGQIHIWSVRDWWSKAYYCDAIIS